MNETPTPPPVTGPEDYGAVEPIMPALDTVAKFTTPVELQPGDWDQYDGQVIEPKPNPNDDAAELGEWDAGADGAPIPPRGWLLGTVFCRRFVSSIIAEGGAGKTALRTAQALALATGQPITGEHIFQRCRVLIVSLEDDMDELRRRVLAARLHHGISQDDVRGRLFLATPDAAAGKIMIADETGHAVRSKLADTIEDCIVKRAIDIAILDPFVKSHAVKENNNVAMDAVVGLLADMAAKHNIAIDVPHHTRKGANNPGNADAGRGASAMKDAARLVYTLARMTPEEAQTLGIAEKDRRYLIRMDSGKVNIAPPLEEAKWFRLVGVPLGNATDLYPKGDEVQTVEVWTPPDAWDGLSSHLLNRILDEIDAGLPDGNRYSDGSRAGDRAAWRAVTKHAPDKTEPEARRIIKTWTKNGVLVSQDCENPTTRKTVKGLRVVNGKRPT